MLSSRLHGYVFDVATSLSRKLGLNFVQDINRLIRIAILGELCHTRGKTLFLGTRAFVYILTVDLMYIVNH